MSEMQYIMFIPFYLYFIQDVHNEKDMIFGLLNALQILACVLQMN